MRVKINGRIYDANVSAIVIELSQYDKDNIAAMNLDATRYGVFPDGQYTPSEVDSMMSDGWAQRPSKTLVS